jgi:hypothetical protein
MDFLFLIRNLFSFISRLKSDEKNYETLSMSGEEVQLGQLTKEEIIDVSGVNKFLFC